MSNQKILVIDDSKVIRMRVKDMLPEGNFKIIEAKDGLEGFNLIRTENPNLIMLDFLLPKMSGWEVYQAIQKEKRLRNIPLVLMSGRKEEVTDKLPEPFEYFAFVEKPFDGKQLVDAIREAMVKSKKQSHLTQVGGDSSSSHAVDASVMTAEIESLKSQVEKMEKDMEQMRKQMNQLINFIRQKFS